MAKIAYLGTGLLGGALAEAAAGRGDEVSAWNRTASKARDLERFGIRAAATPADAVRGAERVHLVLKDDAAVEEVIAAARPGLLPDAVVLDHTTALPSTTAERAKRLRAEGVAYLHCPVFIGPAAARQAQGIVLVAGPKALYDRVAAGLAPMASKVLYVGERDDLAALDKLFGNAVIVGLVGIVADVFAIAREGGVEPAAALELLKGLDLNAMLSRRGSAMAKGDDTTSFELTMARKDVGLMIDSAGGRPLAVLPSMAARMDALIAQGEGAADVCVIGIERGGKPA